MSALPLFPSPRPHWKASSPPDWSHRLKSVLVARLQLLSWGQQRQSHVRAAGRDVLGSASPTGRVSPAGHCSSPVLLCQGQPGGLTFNEVLVSHDFLHHRKGMSRWSGFKAGHGISIRAPLLILNLGKKQELGVGGFSVPQSVGALLSPCVQGGPGAVGFSCSLTGRNWLLLPFIILLRGQGGHGSVLIGVIFGRKCKTLRGCFTTAHGNNSPGWCGFAVWVFLISLHFLSCTEIRGKMPSTPLASFPCP